MICNTMTSTIALLRMSEKKRQKTLSNQQQANRLMFVLQKKTCQTCDLIQQKFIILTKNVTYCQNMGFFFCFTWLTDICHFEKDTFQLSSFQELMDYASLEVNKKKKKEIGEYV